jgi:hypothetical protein
MTPVEWLVLLLGLVAIGLVNWWFFGSWSGHRPGDSGHHH